VESLDASAGAAHQGRVKLVQDGRNGSSRCESRPYAILRLMVYQEGVFLFGIISHHITGISSIIHACSDYQVDHLLYFIFTFHPATPLTCTSQDTYTSTFRFQLHLMRICSLSLPCPSPTHMLRPWIRITAASIAWDILAPPPHDHFPRSWIRRVCVMLSIAANTTPLPRHRSRPSAVAVTATVAPCHSF